ncbi:hypothetical protein SOVF_110140 [Spinacia oleracea]|nr:hypothetical protein SOVF_110140 [Spinacia oleracea]
MRQKSVVSTMAANKVQLVSLLLPGQWKNQPFPMPVYLFK